MGFLKDGRFWGGVVVGYLALMFIPQLNFRGKAKVG
jgi:hypothetical protein